MQVIRKRSNRNTLFLIVLVMIRTVLPADELTDALAYEKEGKTTEAKAAYVLWLGQDANQGVSSYGRTLLHLLRMGGESLELLDLLDLYLPRVGNGHDRMEILRFGAYLADLIGQNQRAQSYFSLLATEEREPFEWIHQYYGFQEGVDSSPDDPLSLYVDAVDESSVKYKALAYLLFLNTSGERDDAILQWLGNAAIQFPFLKKYPEWLFTAWFFCSSRQYSERAESYRSELLSRYPESPEAGIIKGDVQLFFNPAFVRVFLKRDETAEDSPSDKRTFYLQAGAFDRSANAMALQEEIREKTDMEVQILHTGNVYKVIISTENPDRDRRGLNRLGYETFMIPQPVWNH